MRVKQPGTKLFSEKKLVFVGVVCALTPQV